MSTAERTLTFLFTDIEGSTRLWDEYPESMPQVLARHDEILRLAIEGSGGVVFKTVGDAFHGAFTQAPAALRAALEAQRGLTAAEWPGLGGFPAGVLRARMALHSGQAEARDGDYFGAPLNHLSRLLSAGHGGQVLLSSASEELVRDALPPGVHLRDMGERRLKDLARPSRVFQLVAADLVCEFPPLKTLDDHPHNLPEQPTPLLGREKEVAAARDELLRSDVRLLTFTGPGGTGKTRLALQTAAEVLHHFTDGAFFVALAPLGDPGLVASTIAQTLGIKETADQKIEAKLQEYLSDKELLLMLDNFEQIVEASSVVSDLLAGCPKLKVLVTSRVALHLRGEQEFPVPPLALPNRKPPPPLGVLSQYAAVQLFIQRARAVKPEFAVTNENAPAVAEICARLDGLPLAIELAAARSKVLSPQAMLSRLEHRLQLLTGGARDLPQRQQTLRGAIAWSYDLLEAEEKVLFRRMSVFVGGCTLEAAEAVCGEGLGIDVFDGVCSLVDKSLLKQEEDGAGEARFWTLETIREFGLEQLGACGEAAEMRRTHAGYLLQLAKNAKLHSLGEIPSVGLKHLTQNRDNFRAALDWSLTHDIEIAARLIVALTSFWALSSSPEGELWAHRGVAEIDRLPINLRIKLLTAVTHFASLRSNEPRMRHFSDRLQELSRQTNDQRGIEFGLRFQAKSALLRGDAETALHSLKESLMLAREENNPSRVATCLMTMGDSHTFHTRDFDMSRSYYSEALTNFEEDGYARGIAMACSRLALLAGCEGNLAEAYSLYNRAVPILLEYGDKASIAWYHLGMGELAIKKDDVDSARKHLSESLSIFHEQEVNDRIPDVLLRLAFLEVHVEQWERAARLLGAQEMPEKALRVPGNEWYVNFIRDAVKVAVGEGTLETEWTIGSKMSLNEAVEYAERVLDENHCDCDVSSPRP